MVRPISASQLSDERSIGQLISSFLERLLQQAIQLISIT
jgi:hypothetical protein